MVSDELPGNGQTLKLDRTKIFYLSLFFLYKKVSILVPLYSFLMPYDKRLWSHWPISQIPQLKYSCIRSIHHPCSLTQHAYSNNGWKNHSRYILTRSSSHQNNFFQLVLTGRKPAWSNSFHTSHQNCRTSLPLVPWSLLSERKSI